MRRTAAVVFAIHLLLLTAGCSDEPPPSPLEPEETAPEWQQEVESGSQDWLAFRKILDGWAALNVQHFRILDEDLGNDILMTVRDYFAYREPVIGKHFHAYITQSRGRGITIGSNDWQTLPLAFSSLDQLDPRLSPDCRIVGGTLGPFAALSDDAVLVFACWDPDSSPEGMPVQQWVYRLQIDATASQESGRVSLSGWERLPKPGDPGESLPVAFSWLGYDDFLVSTMQASYRLDGDGTMVRVMDERVGSVLRLPGRLLAAGDRLRESTDGGRTWIEHEGFDGIGTGIGLFVAGDELYGWHNSGMVRLHPVEDARSIDRQGIISNIVGIHVTEDQIYVATWRGLFSKALADFQGS